MDIKEIVKHFGSATKTAAALGVSRQTVHNWMKGRSGISALRAQDIEIRMSKAQGSAA